MIKLFLIYQLKGENGVEEVPHLEGECVEQAFIEMRNEGYEDDGLFEDMKLFFQPLTITDEELKINPNELENTNREEKQEIQHLENEIIALNNQYQRVQQELQQLTEKRKREKSERDRKFEEHEKSMKKEMSYQERTRKNVEWCRHADDAKTNIDALKKQITEKENRLKDIETPRIEKENRQKTINVFLAKQQKIIDRSLIQLHRGFIMYGPPGKSSIFSCIYYLLYLGF